ncbi:FAD-binding protein [Streptomyces sp. NPDC048611]|uniref:FAD-binding protein n=1 Tax=Streptomyces sp. NPDC048611 TaxID=3155635 RepID=UPI0034367DE3
MAPEVIVRPGDERYAALAARGNNTRFTSTPDEIWLVHSPAQVEKAVNQAVREKQRITVRGGGHCFDGLVGDPQYHVLVDTSEMKAVYFDPAMNAFAVESGALLGEVYRTLYEGRGVTVPRRRLPRGRRRRTCGRWRLWSAVPPLRSDGLSPARRRGGRPGSVRRGQDRGGYEPLERPEP